jgi:hypothetical protein
MLRQARIHLLLVLAFIGTAISQSVPRELLSNPTHRWLPAADCSAHSYSAPGNCSPHAGGRTPGAA